MHLHHISECSEKEKNKNKQVREVVIKIFTIFPFKTGKSDSYSGETTLLSPRLPLPFRLLIAVLIFQGYNRDLND